jgi:hypothetical protein
MSDLQNVQGWSVIGIDDAGCGPAPANRRTFPKL